MRPAVVVARSVVHARSRAGDGQLGPDALPVVGPQVPAMHLAVGDALDLGRAVHRHGLGARLPSRDDDRAHAQLAGDARRLAARGKPKVCLQIHATMLAHGFQQWKPRASTPV